MIVDIHAHLELCKDTEELIARAKKAGVVTILTSGSTVHANRSALELSTAFDIVQPALGLYPTDALDMTDEEIEEEIAFIRGQKDNIMGIGEIGLDYKETEDRTRQQKIFEQFLTLAKEINKTVIVHSRRAEAEVIDTVKRLQMKKVILHSFEGNKTLIKQAADAGFHVSIPSNIERSSHWQNAVQIMPLKQLLTETDAPFLSRDKDGSSEPAHIRHAISKIAEIKGLTNEETENALFLNYQRLFL